jgi:F0F1-type ATP synthase membrane subunit b/b'
MDREGPAETTPEEAHGEELPARPQAEGATAGESVAAETSARVGTVLGEAEAEANSIREAAEREARQVEDAASSEASGLAQAAHTAARAEARERAERVAELRASIAARATSLTEGLEGGELTRVRLEELVELLGEAERRILTEVAEGPGEVAGAAVAAAPAPESPSPATTDDAPAAFDGLLPEGAPLMRMPARSGDREADARFAAVLIAVQGGERDEVAEHLRAEYGDDDWDGLLNEVFGRADAKV